MASWPTGAEFNEAIQSPSLCFTDPELRRATAELNRLQLPKVWSGQFAAVFKLRAAGGQSLAVRCFLRDVGDREDRYRAIDQYLTSQQPPGFSRFRYLKSGVRIKQGMFPVLVMNWVDGQTLDDYVLQANPSQLSALPERWQALVQSLEARRIAHGDLQHGNVLFAGGQFCLVDYDGMFVPALQGRRSTEVGHRHYQHPARTDRDFDAHIDRFAALVIYTSLVAFAEHPALRSECDDSLLFKAGDYRDWPASSTAARVRRELPQLTPLMEAIRAGITGPLLKVATLSEVAPLAPVGVAGSAGSAGWWRDQVSPEIKAGSSGTATSGASAPAWVRDATSAAPRSPGASTGSSGIGSPSPTTRHSTSGRAARLVGRTIKHMIVRALVLSPVLILLLSSSRGQSLDANEATTLYLAFASLVTGLAIHKVRREERTHPTKSPAATPRTSGSTSAAPRGVPSPATAPAPRPASGGPAHGQAPAWIPGGGSAQPRAAPAGSPTPSQPPPNRPANSSATPTGSWPPRVTTPARSSTVWPPQSPPPSTTPPAQPTWTTAPLPGVASPGSSTSSTSTPAPGTPTPSVGPLVVASSTRGKYHHPFCEWAMKISASKRITYSSATEARQAGLRPCRVCNP
jgi:hypothetical protein